MPYQGVGAAPGAREVPTPPSLPPGQRVKSLLWSLFDALLKREDLLLPSRFSH